MSKFDTAFDITMGHEGGYSNDPDDRGGETYRGIARNFHPQWTGWRFLDPKKINHKLLDPHVREFYLIEFWGKLQADWFRGDVAEELFDTGVNVGIRQAGKFLQHALNLLNNNQKYYDDLIVDGWIGKATLKAYKSMPIRYAKALTKVMNILQGAFYVDLMDSDSRREKWVGWFGRVSL